ncbi:hypothetical protein KJF94_25900 [Pseudomonas hormoni]|uniref:DUF3108 domain-containing protein n=1 Tax=Pseudomonas hormoni TaxID=3093767 RepID=A0ABX8EX68_9PSED|nr:hypothetical protein [Pseudomonas hormoni]QVW23242.1 hypothetical protein KJF94_25900 [Pseudomonas hormoni]
MKMSALIFILTLCGAVNTYAAELDKSFSDDLYEVDKRTQGLKVSWSGGSFLARGVIGNKGEITRDLVDFDGRKVLHYENLATSTPFEAYVTVKRGGEGLVVDCIYANIRSNQNGLLINKAVCGLDKKLVANYEQLIYDFSSVWKDSARLVKTSSLMEDPITPATVEEANIKDIKILRIYKTPDDLVSTLPTTIVRRDMNEHSFGANMVFTVFNAADLIVPVYVEVASKNLEARFERLDYKKLNALLN